MRTALVGLFLLLLTGLGYCAGSSVGVGLESSAAAFRAKPRSTVLVSMVITNVGSEPDTFFLKARDMKIFKIDLMPQTTLAANGSFPIGGYVHIPNIMPGQDRITVRATSKRNPAIFTECELLLNIEKPK